MIITKTTTINISPENVGLIPVVVNNLNYQEWKGVRINKASEEAYRQWVIDNTPPVVEPVEGEEPPTPPEPLDTSLFEFDLSTVDTSEITFIKEYLAKEDYKAMVNLIAPAIDKYFGVVMKAKGEAVKGLLAQSITSEVTVE